MRIENLRTPGVISNGLDLRKAACKSISIAELYLSDEGRQELADFFLDCAKHAAPVKKKAAPKPQED